MDQRHESAELLRIQRDKLKRTLDRQRKWGMRPTAIILAAFGALLFALWLLTNDGTTASMLLVLISSCILVFSVQLFFLSPSRYMNGEICDSMAISGIDNLSRILSLLLIEEKGIYLPADKADTTKVFIPVGKAPHDHQAIKVTGSKVFNVSEGGINGIILEPPGYGLFRHSKKIGAAFTDAGIEREIKDLMENSLELASKVTVTREPGRMTVVMSGLANSGMCAAIRKDYPNVCLQTGCPVCSVVGCMIVDGTGRMARVEDVRAKGDTITLTYELL